MIKLIITGGTLDKQYHPISGELFFPETHLNQLLKQARCTLAIENQVLMQKDSLEMDDNDRRHILQACLDSPQKQIVITHGTDTLVKTAQSIAKEITEDKTVILVGAMIPYSMQYSDALFNIGCALTAVQTLNAGVYITMNGHIFNWDNVKKETQIGEFKTVFNV